MFFLEIECRVESIPCWLDLLQNATNGWIVWNPLLFSRFVLPLLCNLSRHSSMAPVVFCYSILHLLSRECARKWEYSKAEVIYLPSNAICRLQINGAAYVCVSVPSGLIFEILITPIPSFTCDTYLIATNYVVML